MKCLVTGAAGFIGSRLSHRLLEFGYSVVGIDSFTDYYSRAVKENNLADIRQHPQFEFIPKDINRTDLSVLLNRVDAIYHLAAQAGVRASWGSDFSVYTKLNIEATQKLLEASRLKSIEKFIYASSSSVYGHCPDLPMTEDSPLLPYSPYGVTKLAGENLCSLYFWNYAVPTVSMRFFTVYGPGQRPDMAFHRFCISAAKSQIISVFGDGTQTRDFTYIDDIVDALIAALQQGRNGEIYNLGGGNRICLNDIFPYLEELSGRPLTIQYMDRQRGDVKHTFADISKARKDLKYNPKMTVKKGLEQEWLWILNLIKKQIV